MCGIATIAIGRRSRGRIPYKLLRELTRELLYELHPRGMDASGIAVINEGGNIESSVFKKPLRPQRLVVRPRFEEILQTIGPQTNFIMLHTRMATIGDTADNFNNHPIVTSPIVGIHNGTLINENRLFKQYSRDFRREGSVDSEIIFRLYHHFTDTMGLLPKQALIATSKELVGAYTGALVDTRVQHRMLMFKFQRSLAILTLPHFDMIITVSEPKFYDIARRRLGIKSRDGCKYPRDGTGFIIDLNMRNRITDNIIGFDIPVEQSLTHLASWFGYGMCG